MKSKHIKQIMIRVPRRTYERLMDFAMDEGITNSSGKPVVTQTVRKMILILLDAHEDEKWKEKRKEEGGSTFGLVDKAIKNHIKRFRNFF